MSSRALGRPCWLPSLLLALVYAAPAVAAVAAFPGAEGFGAQATGGRATKVVHVTNLADSGAGSLRDAISQGNRIVVFDVGGVITLASKLAAGGDNLTIAGQTAPGDGITVYGNGTSFSGRKNIVVRFVRFHQGVAKDSAEGTKAVNLTDAQNMIFDHVSVQWGRWDCLGITGDSASVTVQDSIIGESLVPQKFGALVDSADQITIARTLWIDNESRNPKLKANGQYINNVIYNWGSGGGLIGGHSSADWYEDVINNYFIAGPANTGSALSQYASSDRVYHQGNLVDVDRDGKLGGRAVVDADFKGDSPPTFEAAAHNHPSVPVAVLTPQAAYERIVAQAGVCGARDAVDQRLIAQLRSLGTSGAIVGGDDGEAAVGGQPPGTQTQRPAGFDSDGDGMPDAWETAHGLDPASAADGSSEAGDGYTQVEKYLNELASNACAVAPPPPDAGADRPADTAVGRDAVVDGRDALARDSTATVGAGDAGFFDARPGRDLAGAAETTPASPDGATADRDGAADAPARPSDAGGASPDAVGSGGDVPGDAPSETDGRSKEGDAGSTTNAFQSGCSCSAGAVPATPDLPWLLLGLGWWSRRRRH